MNSFGIFEQILVFYVQSYENHCHNKNTNTFFLLYLIKCHLIGTYSTILLYLIKYHLIGTYRTILQYLRIILSYMYLMLS